MESTAQYIYQVLFKEGKNSDITVQALGEEFHLHKVYLCQSPYFASMFGGSWLETTKTYITIDVVDPLITIQCEYFLNILIYIHGDSTKKNLWGITFINSKMSRRHDF